MEQIAQKRNEVWGWLALICGCVCLACLLYILYTWLICWSEFDPMAVALTVAFFCSLVAGPVFALLSLTFGCIGCIRERRKSPNGSRRSVAFSIFGIVIGMLYLIVVLTIFFI